MTRKKFLNRSMYNSDFKKKGAIFFRIIYIKKKILFFAKIISAEEDIFILTKIIQSK